MVIAQLCQLHFDFFATYIVSIEKTLSGIIPAFRKDKLLLPGFYFVEWMQNQAYNECETDGGHT